MYRDKSFIARIQHTHYPVRDSAFYAACPEFASVAMVRRLQVEQRPPPSGRTHFKRFAKGKQDIAEVVCVNPVSVKVKYAEGELIEVKQVPEDVAWSRVDRPAGPLWTLWTGWTFMDLIDRFSYFRKFHQERPIHSSAAEMGRTYGA